MRKKNLAMNKKRRDRLRDRAKRAAPEPAVISRLVYPGFGKRVRLHRKGASQYIYQP